MKGLKRFYLIVLMTDLSLLHKKTQWIAGLTGVKTVIIQTSSGLTFSREHHLFPWCAFSPSWCPSMSPEEERRLIGGVGLEGEDTREACSACQHLLHRRMTDPTHVHNGGGCSHRETNKSAGALNAVVQFKAGIYWIISIQLRVSMLSY